ncbi:MAG: response regulator [Desulfobulbaceae bacterium]|nr:response regulator [Desulfobulbaceae bacterium]
MNNLVLEIIHFVAVGLIVYALLRSGEGMRDVKGWRWVFGGFVLMIVAALGEIVGHYVNLNGVVVGGYLGGFVLLAVGFWQWLPSVAAQMRGERELRDSWDNLEQLVQQRTSELVQAKEAAEAANEAKNQFLVNMSHELRTPINGIVGFADILSDMDIGEEPHNFVKIIKSSTGGLVKIVDDVLDFSKLEGGKLTFQETDFHLREVLEEVRAKLTPQAEEKSLALKWDIDEGVPDVLRGDPARLAQVVSNLLDNCIMFTDEGEVGLRIRLDKNDDAGVQLLFAVHDTAVGMVADKQDNIFDADDGSHVRQRGGAGLGLVIASRLVRMMGGTIWSEDNGKSSNGSFFKFTAKFGHGVANKLSADVSEMFTTLGRHILLAEDEPVNQMLTTRILQWQGWEVTSVDNGRKALEAIAEQSFDLVLMDVQMPEMNGMEATAAIRAEEANSGGHVKIIALTAHAMPGDREQCMDAGMDGYIEKPFRAEELVAVVERHLA